LLFNHIVRVQVHHFGNRCLFGLLLTHRLSPA
jgi:hypothetical protein